MPFFVRNIVCKALIIIGILGAVIHSALNQGVCVLSAKGDKKAVLISCYGKEDIEDKVIELTLSGFEKVNNKVTYKVLDNEFNLDVTKDEYINGEKVTLYIKMKANSVLLLDIE